MWDLCRTKWHWDRFFSKFFGFLINIILPWLSILIYQLGDDGRSSETSPHPIDMSKGRETYNSKII
jgi:hypothetical protein